jgi:hypothetical protein
MITFKANTGNTGACTLNVNSLGAKSIKVDTDVDPATGDIKAGQIVTVIYDGVNFQLQTDVPFEVSPSSTNTLTNKRITRRVYSTTTLTTLTPEIANYDEFALTALTSALTIANHSTSTPADGDKMIISITPDATPRAFTWGDKYVAKAGVALPTTTTASKTIVMGFRWDAGLAKWNLLASGIEA